MEARLLPTVANQIFNIFTTRNRTEIMIRSKMSHLLVERSFQKSVDVKFVSHFRIGVDAVSCWGNKKSLVEKFPRTRWIKNHSKKCPERFSYNSNCRAVRLATTVVIIKPGKMITSKFLFQRKRLDEDKSSRVDEKMASFVAKWIF